MGSSYPHSPPTNAADYSILLDQFLKLGRLSQRLFGARQDGIEHRCRRINAAWRRRTMGRKRMKLTYLILIDTNHFPMSSGVSEQASERANE